MLLIILTMYFISREPFIILSGGLSYDTVGRRPCLTVMHGKSTAVLEMDYSIVDFLTLCETPYANGKFCIFKASFSTFRTKTYILLVSLLYYVHSSGKRCCLHNFENFISEVNSV